MRINTFLGTVFVFLLLSACSKSDNSPAAIVDSNVGSSQTETADSVFSNGKIYTVNPEQEWAEAVAVKDGKIVYVGDNAGASALIGESTEAVDLQGRMLMPGFVSEHDHLVATKWTSYGVDLSATKTVEEALTEIKAYADANPDNEVVLGLIV